MIELLAGAACAAMQPAHLGEMRMHLYYRETGRLSRDISPPNAFVGANVLIGDGDAEENADDLLVAVELVSEAACNIDGPITLAVRDADGRLLAERTFGDVLTSDRGRAWLPLFVPDLGCAGALRATATFGNERREENMAFECRE